MILGLKTQSSRGDDGAELFSCRRKQLPKPSQTTCTKNTQQEESQNWIKQNYKDTLKRVTAISCAGSDSLNFVLPV